MTQDVTARLEAMMRRHGIAELEIDEGDLRIRLRHRGTSSAAVGARIATTSRNVPPSGGTVVLVRADTFGTLHLAHPASAAGTAMLPRKAVAGEIVAWLAVGPLLRPVAADRDLTLLRLLSAEGAEIGHGDPLFEAVEA